MVLNPRFDSMRPPAQWVAMSVVLLALSAFASAGPAVTLFADGQPRVYLDRQTSGWQALDKIPSFEGSAGLALEDLNRCFELLGGRPLPTEAGAGRIPLRLQLLESAADLGHQGYLVDVSDREILLAAPRPMGLVNAVYDLLERLGCHWIMPGPEGELISRTGRLELAVSTTRWNNSFDGRFEQTVDETFNLWRARNRMGWTEWNGVQHAFQIIYLPADQYFKDHPDWYDLSAGRRVPRQLETAHPQVIEQILQKADDMLGGNVQVPRMAFPVEWDDLPEMSTSPQSLALDPPNNPTFMGMPSMTDRTVTLANLVAEHIESRFPDKYVGFYAYMHHTLPPVAVKPRKNILLGLTRAGFSVIHYMPTEKDPTSLAWWKLLDDWQKLGVTIFTYEYDPLPWSAGLITPVHLERPRMLKMLWERGIKGSYTDRGGPGNEAANFVTRYIEMRIKADPRRNPETELAELCRIFFGPAAEPMNRYYLVLDEATRTNYPDHHFTNMGLYTFADIYTPDMIARAKAHLQKAVTAAKSDSATARRVEMVERQFNYMEQFLSAWWAARAGDQKQTLERFANAIKMIEPLAAMNPRYIQSRVARLQVESQQAVVMAQYFPDYMRLQRVWSVLGPFPNKYGDANFYEQMYPADWFDGPVRPGQPVKLKDGTTLRWKAYRSPEGMIDFSTIFGKHTGDQPLRAAYAGIELETPHARTAYIRLDSFHTYRLYLNGTEIHYRDKWSAAAPDREVVKVELPAGKSELILRSSQVVAAEPAARWGFYLRITDEHYQPIEDLRIGPLK